jgi:hypothetical protein
VIPQHVYRDELTRATDALIERAEQHEKTLTDARIASRPPEGGWTVAQVFEHLVIANDSYLKPMRLLVAQAQPVPDPGRTWRPTLMGGLLLRSFRSPRQLPAPRIYRPGPEPRPRVIAAFIGGMRELRRMLLEAADLDWRSIRMTSPVSRLIRLNLGDAFGILVRHAERHFRQVDRLLARVEA